MNHLTFPGAKHDEQHAGLRRIKAPHGSVANGWVVFPMGFNG